jgi:MATE family multidrug resistance protein
MTIWHMLTLNLPLFLRTLILKGVFVMLTLRAASLGVTEAAALGLLLILLSTAAYALDGFAFASEIETGQSVGRRDRRRLALSLWAGAMTTALATIGIIALYHLLAAELIGQLTIHEAVALRATALLPWLSGILAVLAGSYWLDGVFIGLLRPTAMFISMLLAGVTWLCGLWFFGSDRLDLLLAAFMLFGIVRTLSLGIQLPGALAQLVR